MNRAQLRAIISDNQHDNGLTFFEAADINNTLQDAYNDISVRSQQIIKSVTLNWLSQVNYYDFLSGNSGSNTAITDYLGTIAIFNNVTNQWLRDDISIRDYDRLRRDWEIWRGMPQFWTPHSLRYIAVAPCLQVGVGTFKLFYWASAPAFTSDNDTPLVSADMQTLFEQFGTADTFESSAEIVKAQPFWTTYFKRQLEYKERCRRLCKADILQRI